MTITSAQRALIFGPLVDYPTGRGVPARLLETVTSPWGPKVRVHELIADHWLATAQAAAELVPGFVPGRLDSFAPRVIRNTLDKVSFHAWGLAHDGFLTPLAQGAPKGGVWQPDELETVLYLRDWLGVWRAWGWTCGADWTSPRDTPHVEWRRGVPGPEHRPAPPGPGDGATGSVPTTPEVPVEYVYPSGARVELTPDPATLLSCGPCVVGVAPNGHLYVMGADRDRRPLELAIVGSDFWRHWNNPAPRTVDVDGTEWKAGTLHIRATDGAGYAIGPIVFEPSVNDPGLVARAAAQREALLDIQRRAGEAVA